jgi:hypothetical protein
MLLTYIVTFTIHNGATRDVVSVSLLTIMINFTMKNLFSLIKELSKRKSYY